MRATLYLRKEELESYIEKKGYTIVTLRKIILKNFGFKNSSDLLNKYKNLCSNVLNTKMAYKNQEEYESILVLISDMMEFLESELKNTSGPIGSFITYYGVDILFYDRNTYNDDGLRYKRRNKNFPILYNFTVSSVFRREFLDEVKEKTELNEIYLAI